MVKQAVVFPGQGAQRLGMALDFAEQFPIAHDTLMRADDALPFKLFDIIEKDEDLLNLTEYTQPCIVAAEIAMFDALKTHFGAAPDYFGGHSLGEYSALVAAGAMPLEVAVQLVNLRGQLMQQAVPVGEGAMAALIQDPLPLDDIRALADSENVDLANDNSPAQVVVSGGAAGVGAVIEKLQPMVDDGMRVVPLTVSAPFHSRLMAGIEAEFKTALNHVKDQFNAERAKTVTSNFSGNFHTGDLDDLINALTKQISGTVYWRSNMTALTVVAKEIVEVGPNRPLRGFFKAVGVGIKAVIDVRSAGKAYGTPQEVS
jgi:malonyl CoA-acyl carrier protein transacylase